MLSASASNVIVIWYLVGSVINLVLLVGLGFVLFRLNALLTRLSGEVSPVLQKADQVLEVASSKMDTIGGATESILTRGESIAATIERQTEQTSRRVSATIYRPFVGMSALLSGVSQGARTFRLLRKGQKQKGN